MTLAQLIAQFYRPFQPSFAAVIAPIQDALMVAGAAGSGHAIAPSVASLFEAKYGAMPEQASEAARLFTKTYIELSAYLLPDFIGEYTFEACAEAKLFDYENQVITLAQATREWGMVDLGSSPVKKWKSGRILLTTYGEMFRVYGPPKKSIV